MKPSKKDGSIPVGDEQEAHESPPTDEIDNIIDWFVEHMKIDGLPVMRNGDVPEVSLYCDREKARKYVIDQMIILLAKKR